MGPLTDFYAKSMSTAPARWAFRKSGKRQYTQKHMAGLKATADLKAADRNPYSWNMEFFAYPDGSGYEAGGRLPHLRQDLSASGGIG